MNTETFAPIVIPTLCRYEHFRRCVESLACCTYADKSDLFIALDYPLDSSHWDGYRKICAYLDAGVSGFKSLTVLKREENYGVVNNSNELIDFVLQSYDCYIFTEDDNEFSPNFLDYINWGLRSFENDKSILAICGFHRLDMNGFTSSAFSYPHFSAWGYGIWRDRRLLFKEAGNHDLMRAALKRMPLWKVFSDEVIIANKYLNMISRDTIWGDSLTTLFPNPRMHSVFPTVRKVKNWGNDGSGVNCNNLSLDKYYKTLPIDSDKTFHPVINGPLYQKEILDKIYKATYPTRYLRHIWCSARFLIYKLTGKIISRP